MFNQNVFTELMNNSKRCNSDSSLVEPRKRLKQSDKDINSIDDISETSGESYNAKCFKLKKPTSGFPFATNISATDDSIQSRSREDRSPKNIFHTKTVHKRKFPGPAGLLPERNADRSELQSSSEMKNVEICSQRTCSKFSNGAWEEMMADYKPNSCDRIYLPDKYNVQWVKNKVIADELINQRSPFLAAFILSICCNNQPNATVNVVLKDGSGTINGTILPKLFEEHATKFVVGSVVVLSQVGVLNAGSDTEPHLIITSNNLIAIYATNQNIIDKIIVKNTSLDEIYKNIDEMENLTQEMKQLNSNRLSTNLFNDKTHMNSALNIRSEDDEAEEAMKAFMNEIDDFKCSTQANRCDIGKSTILNESYNVIEKSTSKAQSSSQAGDKENNQIWQDMFEGLDANVLFEDF